MAIRETAENIEGEGKGTAREENVGNSGGTAVLKHSKKYFVENLRFL